MNDTGSTNSLELVVIDTLADTLQEKKPRAAVNQNSNKSKQEFRQYYPVSYFLNDSREIFPKLDSVRDYLKSELYYLLVKDDDLLKNEIDRKLFDEFIYKHFEEKYSEKENTDALENYWSFLYTVLSINNFRKELMSAGFLKMKYGVYYVSRNLLKYILERFATDLFTEKKYLHPENYLKNVNTDNDRFEKYWMWEVEMK